MTRMRNAAVEAKKPFDELTGQQRRARHHWRLVADERVRSEIARRGISSIPWPTASWLLCPLVMQDTAWGQARLFVPGLAILMAFTVFRAVLLWRASHRAWQMDGGDLALVLPVFNGLLWGVLSAMQMMEMQHFAHAEEAQLYFSMVACVVIAGSPYTLAPKLNLLIAFNCSVAGPVLAWLLLLDGAFMSRLCVSALLMTSLYSVSQARMAHQGFRKHLLAELSKDMHKEACFVHIGRDPLTGVLNRKRFAQAVDRVLRDPQAGAHCLLIFGVDHLRELNRRFGREAGDLALRQCAAHVAPSLPKADATLSVASAATNSWLWSMHSPLSRSAEALSCAAVRSRTM